MSHRFELPDTADLSSLLSAFSARRTIRERLDAFGRHGWFRPGRTAGDAAAPAPDLHAAPQATDPVAAALAESADAAAGTGTAYSLSGGQSAQGQLTAGSDHDWYRVQLMAGETYSFALTGTGGAGVQVNDPFLRLRNSAGTQIVFDDDSGAGLNSVISFRATASGTYYLDAGGYGDAYAGRYTLAVTGRTGAAPAPQPPAAVLAPTRIVEAADAAASSATAYALAIGKTAQGKIASLGDHDWFKLTLVAGQTYTFAMIGTGVSTVHVEDTYLRLRNSAGAQLAVDDDAGPGTASTLTFKATASGTYYLDAGAYGDSYTGQYGLSATLGTKAFYDEMMGAGALIRPDASWSTPGMAATVTWGVRSTFSGSVDASGNTTPFIALSAAQIASVEASLAKYSDVARITFTRVNPAGKTDNAAILVSAYSSSADGAGAYAYYPGSSADSGDLRLNNTSVSTTSLPDGSYGAFAIMHEMGHAVGLAHPGDYNAAPGLPITYGNNAAFIQDDHQYSLMSYFDESNTTSSYNGYPDTLMLYDILALQQLYGANMATRAGNTIYGFGSNAGAPYNFSTNTTPVLSIWDGGGSDTINASGFAQGQKIDLHAGAFSNIGGMTGNVSIAFGATIENAVGGSGADTLVGNAAGNSLTGGAGRDSFVFQDPLSSLNLDRITDFSVADDTLVLDRRVFAALAPGGPLSADAFRLGAAAADATDRILYDRGSGALSYDRDGAGGYAAVRFASLAGSPALTGADFRVA